MRLGVLLLLLLVACEDQSGMHATPTAATRQPPPRAPAAQPRGVETTRIGPDPEGADDVEDIADGDDGDPSEQHDTKCAPIDPNLKPLQVLRFKFSSDVKNREGVDKLSVLRPGQRVYAHFTMRNRSGSDRCMHLVFRVNGKKRTTMTLGIGKSWSWRTWAYNTVRPEERGFLELEATDDQGKLVLRERLAIVPEPKR